jgi:cytochrome c oxidase subunit IV
MRLQGRVFLGIAAFLLVIGTVYWFGSYEAAGTVLLIGSAILSSFAGVYLLIQQRRFPIPAEDEPDATVAEGAGEVGVFPTATAWPFVVGIGTVIMFNGLAAGVWIFVGGAVVFLAGVIGYVFSIVWRSGAAEERRV